MVSSLQGDLQARQWNGDVLLAGQGGIRLAELARMSSVTFVRSNRLTCESVSSIVRWFLFLLQENLQIYLKSTQGPIEVYLCPEEGQEADSPTKEALPSTSTLSPVPDCAQPGCSTDSGLAETIESSGRSSPEGEVGVALLLPGLQLSAVTQHAPRRGAQCPQVWSLIVLLCKVTVISVIASPGELVLFWGSSVAHSLSCVPSDSFCLHYLYLKVGQE